MTPESSGSNTIGNRVVAMIHSTPASRRMRFPRLPASCPCIVTQTSFPVCGCTNSRWLPLPVRFSTKPAFLSFRMTSPHVESSHFRSLPRVETCGPPMVGGCIRRLIQAEAIVVHAGGEGLTPLLCDSRQVRTPIPTR